MVARKANVAKLAVVKVGKDPQGSFSLSPCFECRMECKQTIDCPQNDVIVSQGVDRLPAVLFELSSPSAGSGRKSAAFSEPVFIPGEAARRTFE